METVNDRVGVANDINEKNIIKANCVQVEEYEKRQEDSYALCKIFGAVKVWRDEMNTSCSRISFDRKEEHFLYHSYS